jgi:ankyrin repeat protein
MDANLSIGDAIDQDLANQSGKKLDLHFAIDESQAKSLINKGFDINALTEHSKLTPLLMALRDSRNDVAKCLIEAGCDITINAPGDNTPLHVAVKTDDLETVTLLLDHNFNKFAKNDQGETVLHTALHSPFHAGPMLALLLDKGDNTQIVNEMDNLGRTALLIACEARSDSDVYGRYDPYESVEVFIDARCDPNLKNRKGDSALHLLSRSRHQSPSIKLLLDNGADSTITNQEGESLLYAGCQSNTVDNVQVLVNAGCDTDAVDECGSTVLHQVRSDAVLRIILKAPVPPSLNTINKKDIDGNTPLLVFLTIPDGSDMIASIQAVGAELTVTNYLGESCLHRAVQYANRHTNDLKNIQVLVDFGSDTNVRDKFGQTILHRVSFTGALKIILRSRVRLTLYTINGKDNNGNTPLHIYVALAHGCELVKAIHTVGADLNATNNEGQSCLHVCIRHLHWNSQEIVEYLVENGADIFLQDNDKNVPFDLLHDNEAIDEGRYENIRNYLDDKMKEQRNQSFKRENKEENEENEEGEMEGDEEIVEVVDGEIEDKEEVEVKGVQVCVVMGQGQEQGQGKGYEQGERQKQEKGQEQGEVHGKKEDLREKLKLEEGEEQNQEKGEGHEQGEGKEQEHGKEQEEDQGKGHGQGEDQEQGLGNGEVLEQGMREVMGAQVKEVEGGGEGNGDVKGETETEGDEKDKDETIVDSKEDEDSGPADKKPRLNDANEGYGSTCGYG